MSLDSAMCNRVRCLVRQLPPNSPDALGTVWHNVGDRHSSAVLLPWYRKCALLGASLESFLVWVEWGYKFSTEVPGQPQRSGWLQGDGWGLSHPPSILPIILSLLFGL